MTFNVAEFVNNVSISKDDDFIVAIKKLNAVMLNVYDDAYICRALMWGQAAALENQLTYLANTLLPSFERRLNILTCKGILGESDIDVYKFSNEEKPHVADDTTLDDQVLELEMRIDQIRNKMTVAAVGYIEAIRNHDDLSKDLNLLSFGGIKAKAAERRAVATA